MLDQPEWRARESRGRELYLRRARKERKAKGKEERKKGGKERRGDARSVQACGGRARGRRVSERTAQWHSKISTDFTKVFLSFSLSLSLDASEALKEAIRGARTREKIRARIMRLCSRRPRRILILTYRPVHAHTGLMSLFGRTRQSAGFIVF